MKASRLITPVAALLAGYTFASWIVGAKVESAFNEQYRLLESVPYLKVVERKYERGILSSNETATIELMGDMVRAMDKVRQQAADEDAGEAHQAVAPLRFTVRSRISHGPLPRLSMFAAALSESELVLDEQMPAALRQALGERKPLTARTVYRFDGGGTADVSSPAFAATLPGDAQPSSSRMKWEGFTAKIIFERNFAAYTIRGEAPKLEIVDEGGAGLAVAGLKFEADEKRMFDDEPLLYVGTQRMTIAQLGVLAGSEDDGPSALATQVSFDTAMPLTGEFLDVTQKFGVAKLQLGETEYGPARFELSLRHLHARAVADFYRELMKLYAKPEFFTSAAAAGGALAPLAAPAQALLRQNPELRIERLSFRTEQGEAAVTASARLKDARSEEFANPTLLLPKLEAAADIAVPESLLADLPFSPTQQQDEDCEDGETPAQSQRIPGIEQQLEQLVQQGYVTRADGMVRSKLEFRGGQLAVNGKPFPPAGAAPAAVR